MPIFGVKSLQQIDTLDGRLKSVCFAAIEHVDFSVLEGHRDLARQRQLFHEGKTKIDGVVQLSKHNYMPSIAMDLLPFPVVLHSKNIWLDQARFRYFAGIIMGIAMSKGIPLRWGGDWDGDLSAANQSFHDLPHFELVE